MNTLLVEYDDLLIGKEEDVDYSNFYGGEANDTNQKIALMIIRYVIEELLQWSREDAVKKFDNYIVDTMKLTKLIKYIDYPPEVPFGNTRYILSLLYPKEVKLNQQILCEETYQDVLDGKNKQFPRDYFSGGVGFQRFCHCLKYLIERYKPFSSVEEIYTFFQSPMGSKFLNLYRLQTPIYQFNIDIFKAIRYITRNNPDGELYYTYYSFIKQYSQVKQSEE